MSTTQAPPVPPPRRRTWLETFATLSVIVAATTVTVVTLLSYFNRDPEGRAAPPSRPTTPVPTEPQALDGTEVLGDVKARVAVIEYSDFQCPYCAGFVRDTLPALRTEYVDTGRVRIAFKHLPLPMHPAAGRASEAVECAGRQGRFWDMHDRLFEDPSRLDAPTLKSLASGLGLDGGRYDACLARDARATIARDMADARKLNISATPTFLIGRIRPDGLVAVERVLPGAPPLPMFKAALDALLR